MKISEVIKPGHVLRWCTGLRVGQPAQLQRGEGDRNKERVLKGSLELPGENGYCQAKVQIKKPLAWRCVLWWEYLGTQRGQPALCYQRHIVCKAGPNANLGTPARILCRCTHLHLLPLSMIRASDGNLTDSANIVYYAMHACFLRPYEVNDGQLLEGSLLQVNYFQPGGLRKRDTKVWIHDIVLKK